MAIFMCPGCRRIVAKHGRRFSIITHNQATLERRALEAPRIKCACGKVIILLRGELT